ncbi:MAG: hypothetical protein ACFFDB_09765 [Promethearchaeota archaeon]
MVLSKKVLKIFVVFILTLAFISIVNVNGTGFNSRGEMANTLINSNLHQSGGDDGFALCSAEGDQGRIVGIPQACSDGFGGAIIIWGDERNGNRDIYAQHIDEAGRMMWALNGINISSNIDDEDDPQIISDGFGGAIIVWEIYISGSYDILAQRIASNGTSLWGNSPVIVCNATGPQIRPKICSDNDGGAIITWHDDRNLPYGVYEIYAQRIDKTGDPKWDNNGTVVCSVGLGSTHRNPEICSDGSGGAIITWQDNRTSPTNYNIYAQKINASGDVQWNANGIVICNASNEQLTAKIISDEYGGAIITWKDDRTATSYWKVYAQRVDSGGVTRWTENGIVITPYTIHYSEQYMCSDGSGGVIITWRDHRYTSQGDLFAQRIDINGNNLWTSNGELICNVTDMQYPGGISGDGDGGAVIVWRDMRTADYDNWDIYAQQIDSNGKALWDNDGTAICTDGNDQDYPTVIVTTTKMAFFTWIDNRTHSSGWDIYYFGKELIIKTGQAGNGILDLLLSPLVLGGIAVVELIIIIALISRKLTSKRTLKAKST